MNSVDSTIAQHTSCVYRHIRPDTNEVFYVGIGADEKIAAQRRKKVINTSTGEIFDSAKILAKLLRKGVSTVSKWAASNKHNLKYYGNI